MSVSTTPHINFRGQAREGLEFYRTIFDGHGQNAFYVVLRGTDGGAIQARGRALRRCADFDPDRPAVLVVGGLLQAVGFAGAALLIAKIAEYSDIYDVESFSY